MARRPIALAPRPSPRLAPRLTLATVFVLGPACTAPEQTPAGSTSVSAGEAAAEPSAPASPPAEATPATEPTAPTAAEPAGWQRGTVTKGPDGTYAIHADDDSVTVCMPNLPKPLQQVDLAVRFAAELIPRAPNDRRWCTDATQVEVASVD